MAGAVRLVAAVLLACAACRHPTLRSPDATGPSVSPTPEVLADLDAWDAADAHAREAAAVRVARALPEFRYDGLGTYRWGSVSHEIAGFTHLRTGVEFRLVPAPRNSDGAFLIAATELTTSVAHALIGRTLAPMDSTAGLPAVGLTWPEAFRACRAAGWELPTEAEWEHAATAGDAPLPFAAEDVEGLSEFAWHGDNSDNNPHRVALKAPNAFGLYDVLGNVSEWCASVQDVKDAETLPPDPNVAWRWREFPSRGGSFTNTPYAVVEAVHEATMRPGGIPLPCGVRPIVRVPLSR